MQRHESVGPVQRLRHPGHLRELYPPQLLHERDDLRSQLLGRAGNLAADDRKLLLESRVVDPQVQTTPAERVGQIA